MDGSTAIGFRVTDWAAWAPGIETPGDWHDWVRSPVAPLGEGMPALEQVAPMQRRRIDRLGRAAIQAALACRSPHDAGTPMVFASRHGDVARSFALLEALCAHEPMSPTQFGLSVHNAIAAQFSIVCGERGNYTALAGGTASVEMALVEAVGLLADGAPAVTLVACDAPAPATYRQFLDEPDAFFAFAWRLLPAAAGEGVAMTLAWDDADVPEPPHAPPLPHALAAHRFLLSGEGELRRRVEAVGWRWRRHA